MRRSLPFALVLAMLAPRAARADDPHDRNWYGWQTLLADASFIAVFATVPAWQDVGEGGSVALVFDAIAFLGTAPAIHGVHGNGDKGGVALLLNLGLTSIGAIVGFGVGASMPCDCGANAWFCLCGLSNAGWGTYAGTISGASLAAVIDAAALAWEKREPGASTSSATWTVAPVALRGGAGLSLGCAF